MPNCATPRLADVAGTCRLSAIVSGLIAARMYRGSPSTNPATEGVDGFGNRDMITATPIIWSRHVGLCGPA